MKRHRWLVPLIVIVSMVVIVGGVGAQQTSDTPGLLSAFFGLDNALPFGANGLCRGARGQDGMPVILSAVIDPVTLDADDFAVTTESGVVSTPFCATLSPAVDTGELRTVLLIGEFGDADTDPPITVEIVGDVLTSDAAALNFLGARVEVTPLSAGPTLVVAESVPEDEWALDQASGRQRGDGCPSDGTVQIVRVTWAGGISNAEGGEAGEVERALYRVMLVGADGVEAEIVPFALADLGDGDNNHLLCLDMAGEPKVVFFPAGYLYDPNADTPNPDTSVEIQPVGGASS